MKSYGVTIRIKPLQQYFDIVLFVYRFLILPLAPFGGVKNKDTYRIDPSVQREGEKETNLCHHEPTFPIPFPLLVTSFYFLKEYLGLHNSLLLRRDGGMVWLIS